jgi:hypothetical protein
MDSRALRYKESAMLRLSDRMPGLLYCLVVSRLQACSFENSCSGSHSPRKHRSPGIQPPSLTLSAADKVTGQETEHRPGGMAPRLFMRPGTCGENVRLPLARAAEKGFVIPGKGMQKLFSGPPA